MIIYRDLKPENAVVDSNGYVHIIDLGTSKILSESSEAGLRTFTIIGTPHYMAPQIFQAKGYSFSADIWSLGIILYEMVCGVLPYGNCTNDAYSIYKEIHNHPLKFPKKYTDNAGRQLILRLLEKNPDKRQVQNFLDIKNMDYFKNFSWKLLQAQQMQSPHKPKMSHHKLDQKSQYLVNFIQKQKAKIELPKQSSIVGWDSIF